jgi:hypothetical protein
VGAYSTYLGQVRQLLHDTQTNAWSDTTLNGYISEARRRVCKDTYCLRDLYPGLSVTAGTERYVINSFVPVPIQGLVAAICGIDLYYGNSRYPLTYMPWRDFSLKLRYWQNLQQLPVAWSRLGTTTFYVGPIPDQSYTVDLDLAVVPVPLVNDSSPEPIPINYIDAVPWWAARLAKTNEQSLGEMDFFEKEYFKQVGWETAGLQRFMYAPR